MEPVSQEAISAFVDNQVKILNEVVNRSLKCDQEIEQHAGNAKQIITSGLEFTIKLLIPAMQTGEYILLDDQAEWAADRLPHDGVSLEQIVNRLKRLMAVVEEQLTKNNADEINCYIEYLIKQLNKTSKD